MTAEDDFEAYRQEQLTQVRDIRVTDEGLQSFEKGLVRIIVRGEGSSQELKLNELELEALLHAAGAHLSKTIPAYLKLQEMGQQAGVSEQAPQLAAHLSSDEHKPMQHRDGKPPWCRVCGRTADGKVALSRFHEEGSKYVTILDSAGVPVFHIETTPDEPEDRA